MTQSFWATPMPWEFLPFLTLSWDSLNFGGFYSPALYFSNSLSLYRNFNL